MSLDRFLGSRIDRERCVGRARRSATRYFDTWRVMTRVHTCALFTCLDVHIYIYIYLSDIYIYIYIYIYICMYIRAEYTEDGQRGRIGKWATVG